MTGASRLVVVGEGLRAGTTIELAVDAVMISLAERSDGSDYAVAVLDREHGDGVLAVGLPPEAGAGDASVIAGLGVAMAHHFTHVSTPIETSRGLPGATD